MLSLRWLLCSCEYGATFTAVVGQEDDGDVAEEPDDVDPQGGAEEEDLAGVLAQVHQQGAGEVVQ